MNKKRVERVYFLFLCTALVLTARFYIIAKNGSCANDALSGQYTRRIDIAQRYGFVFDRNGKTIDVFKDGYIALVDPSEVDLQEAEDLSLELSKLSENTQSYFYEKILLRKPFIVKVSKNINNKHCFTLDSLCGNNSSFNHLLGYRDSQGNGVTGILKAYNAFLREYTDGLVYASYKADANGQIANGTDIEIFDEGYSSTDGLYLTVDCEVQSAAERICHENLDMGAVVVQDIDSGEIVSLVSMPSYNKNKLSEYLDSDRGELLNRCMLGYTPGSVFKTVIACAALNENTFDADKEYECVGYIEIDGQTIKCHDTKGHGKVNLKTAFAASCNPYFINLGIELGYEKIIKTAKELGIGRYSSINLLPYSKAILPENRGTGSVANMSVGQGELLVSPIEICSMISSAVTRNHVRPSIVSKTVSNGLATDYVYDSKENVLSEENSATMRELFLSCVKDGTGYRAKSDVVTTAGKTATAQSGQIKNGKEVVHTWFAGFFPYEDPRYAVCVLCDGNSEKNEHPSLIFKLIVEEILKIDHE